MLRSDEQRTRCDDDTSEVLVMGEKKRRLVYAIVNGEPRAKIMRFFGMSESQLDGFIERHHREITFKKLKRKA